MPRIRSLVTAFLIVAVVLWVFTPMARGMWLLRDAQHPVGSAPVIGGIRGLDANFYTSDDRSSGGVSNPIPIAGWFYVIKAGAPTIILLPGWKADRAAMTPYAQFLLQAGLNVLMIDMRGSGHSGGEFSLGFNEPMDVKAAVSYLDDPTAHPSVQLSNHHYGVYGVSFGAGVAIAAAGGNGGDYPGTPEILAIVADSPWATEDATVDRLNSLPLPGTSIPLPHAVTLFGHHLTFLPGAQWAVDTTIGSSIDTRSALAGAQNLTADQSLMIIHSSGDTNATTSEAAARSLFDAAKVRHKVWWGNAPGGHIGALSAGSATYEAKVLDFLQKYLVDYKDPPASPAPSYPNSGGSFGGGSPYTGMGHA